MFKETVCKIGKSTLAILKEAREERRERKSQRKALFRNVREWTGFKDNVECQKNDIQSKTDEIESLEYTIDRISYDKREAETALETMNNKLVEAEKKVTSPEALKLMNRIVSRAGTVQITGLIVAFSAFLIPPLLGKLFFPVLLEGNPPLCSVITVLVAFIGAAGAALAEVKAGPFEKLQEALIKEKNSNRDDGGGK